MPDNKTATVNSSAQPSAEELKIKLEEVRSHLGRVIEEQTPHEDVITRLAKKLTQLLSFAIKSVQIEIGFSALELAQTFEAHFDVRLSPWLEVQLWIAAKEQQKAWDRAEQLIAAGDIPPQSQMAIAVCTLAMSFDAWPQIIGITRCHMEHSKAGTSRWANLYYEALFARYVENGKSQPSDLLNEITADGNGPEHITGLIKGFTFGIFSQEMIATSLAKTKDTWGDSRGYTRFAQRFSALTSDNPDQIVEQVRKTTGHTGSDIPLCSPEMARPLTTFDTDKNILVSQKTDGDILVRFAGMGTDFNSLEIDAYASLLNLNSVHLNDANRLLFFNGIPETGDTQSDLITYLREHISALGPDRKVTFMGTSAGGYAAILYGALMGVDRVIAFSPYVVTTKESLIEINDFRARSVLYRVNKNCPNAERHLPSFLEGAEQLPRIDVVYSQGFANDRSHAEQLRPIEGVNLYPILGTKVHDTCEVLMQSGLFADVLTGDMSGVAEAEHRRLALLEG